MSSDLVDIYIKHPVTDELYRPSAIDFTDPLSLADSLDCGWEDTRLTHPSACLTDSPEAAHQKATQQYLQEIADTLPGISRHGLNDEDVNLSFQQRQDVQTIPARQVATSRLHQIEEIRARRGLGAFPASSGDPYRYRPSMPPPVRYWPSAMQSIQNSQAYASWYVKRVCRHYLSYPSALLYVRSCTCCKRVVASWIASVYEKLMNCPYPLVDKSWEKDPDLWIGKHSVAIWRMLVSG